MAQVDRPKTVFPSAREDAGAAAEVEGTPQTRSPSYRLAYADTEFLLREELRAVRLQLELMKPELIQQEQGVVSTVVIFGSTRIPDPAAALTQLEAAHAAALARPEDPGLARGAAIAERLADKSRYYEEARRLAQIVTQVSQVNGHREFVVVTGGGPGIMEAANRGANEVGGKSIELSIVLPHEQHPNPYIAPELSFQFHYFAVRKMHFLLRAKALVAFPGGYGTLDELFETLTLIQTRKVKPVPVVLFGRDYWERIIRFQALVDEGTIGPGDLDHFQYAETAEEAWGLIRDFYGIDGVSVEES
jgi:uncharacterized protein (TIGR00730 family)